MTNFNHCACLGPINGEPHCPCAMKQLGLPRHPEPQITPEALERLQIREWAQLCERQDDVIELNPATVIALLDRLDAAEKALAKPAVEPVDIEDLAHSALQEALSYGLGLDLFVRYFKIVQKASPPPPVEVPLLTDDEIRTIFLAHAKNNAHGVPLLRAYFESAAHLVRQVEQAVRQKVGIK